VTIRLNGYEANIQPFPSATFGSHTMAPVYIDSLTDYRPALQAYCHRLTGNLWDGEDLVQETLGLDVAHSRALTAVHR
jgi:hypothetical protein